MTKPNKISQKELEEIKQAQNSVAYYKNSEDKAILERQNAEYLVRNLILMAYLNNHLDLKDKLLPDGTIEYHQDNPDKQITTREEIKEILEEENGKPE